MAMFSLGVNLFQNTSSLYEDSRPPDYFSIAGLFTAQQTKIVACGTKKMLLSLGIRFFLGPALMVISSYAIGMRGTLLKVAIIQVRTFLFIYIVHSTPS